MPHAAAIVGGAFICAGALVLLNELVLQPHLERRRAARWEREEEEELERAMAVSLQEYEQQWERQSEPFRDTPSFGSSQAAAPADGSGYSGQLRRRRRRGRGTASECDELDNHATDHFTVSDDNQRDPFGTVADNFEMEERRPSSSLRPLVIPHTPVSLLDDNPGVSSPFEDEHAVTASNMHENEEERPLLLEEYSVIQPSPPSSSSGTATREQTGVQEEQVAVPDTVVQEELVDLSGGALSPVPAPSLRSRSASVSSLDSEITIISLPDSSSEGSVPSSPQAIQAAHEVIVPSVVSDTNGSRPISPFSEGEQDDFRSLASLSSVLDADTHAGATSSSPSLSSSGWSDLGEDSSDEEEMQRVPRVGGNADQPQKPFAEPLAQ